MNLVTLPMHVFASSDLNFGKTDHLFTVARRFINGTFETSIEAQTWEYSNSY